MQLIDLCILDAGSLKYSYSVLAATALGIVMGDRALAAAVSGHDWTSFSVRFTLRCRGFLDISLKKNNIIYSLGRQVVNTVL